MDGTKSRYKNWLTVTIPFNASCGPYSVITKYETYFRQFELAWQFGNCILIARVIFVAWFCTTNWRDSHFSVFVCQNWMKKWPSYEHGKRARQSGAILFWAIRRPQAILATFFKLVLPRIYINFDIQTKFEVNQTQIGHSIPKN